MKIQKRNGKTENLSLNKITYRLRKICNDKKLGKLKNIDPDFISQKVVNMIYDGISTSEIDELTGQITEALATENPEYGSVSSRVIISNMHKKTMECFSEVMELLYNNEDIHGERSPIVSDEFIKVVRDNKDIIDLEIDYDRDYNLDYFGYKTLEKSYLNKIYRLKGKGFDIVERPQHMLMRVAIGIHFTDIDKVIETYNLMSQGYFTHATPTLFNAGSVKPQLSSCFLLEGGVDSIDGIYKNISDCAKISKWSGGIGFHIHNIRSAGSSIRGTNGKSDGIIPMLRVYNDTARYVNQGGKRSGSFAVYLEPWHADIMPFLELKKNHGKEEDRARDLFYALWIPDLFMKKVDSDDDWYLMCPNESPGLSDVYSENFDELYNKYVENGNYKEKVKARDVWQRIVTSQIETGGPYMLYKDACNEKSNQKNLGTIKSSNLCSEILLYTSPDEVAVCNLASIALPKFIKERTKIFSLDNYDFEELHRVTKIVIKNLDKVIDRNFYPVPEAKNSNMLHRPLGLGVQGLADTYMKLRIPFDSEEASLLNRHIFEVIEHASIESSMEIAKVNGPYSSFKGSPISNGEFQHNLWGVEDSQLSRGFDWETLRAQVIEYGIRNSTLTALMPTSSTASILGNSECFEQYQSNFFIRRTMSGEFPVVNKFLVEDLLELKLWNKSMRDDIIKDGGSVQNIDSIPEEIKRIYKTAWETSQKSVINQSADRAIFIDQSQSLNLYISEPNYRKITSMHFYAWNKGLKTGQYYLRTRPAVQAIQATIESNTSNKRKRSEDSEYSEESNSNKKAKIECTDDICVMCSG
jgi:ribonucleoside-diphosphate reductase alpha chain